jgi:RNA polymerase sigma-70 factor (ECF subfamily)
VGAGNVSGEVLIVDDAALVARMCAGDDQALARLYDRWARPAYALILQIVRDPDDADDTLEEAFYQAWRQADRFDPARGTVPTWLLTIARSRALDRSRSRRRLREEPMTPAGGGTGRDAVVAADSAEEAERRERVADALKTLPPEQREVVELAYFSGLSQTEIAERTGQPLGTVKTRTRLAGQKLRERLAVFRSDVAGTGEGGVR